MSTTHENPDSGMQEPDLDGVTASQDATPGREESPGQEAPGQEEAATRPTDALSAGGGTTTAGDEGAAEDGPTAEGEQQGEADKSVDAGTAAPAHVWDAVDPAGADGDEPVRSEGAGETDAAVAAGSAGTDETTGADVADDPEATGSDGADDTDDTDDTDEADEADEAAVSDGSDETSGDVGPGGSAPRRALGKERTAELVREGEVAADFLEGLLDIADLSGDLEVDIENDRAAVAIVDSEDGVAPGRLVGPGGQVLDALQELTRLAVQAETGERSRLMLDVAGYRADRRAALVTTARRAVAAVTESGTPKELEPMTAFERKVVHDEVLAAGLRSESAGVEPSRYVVVLPS